MRSLFISPSLHNHPRSNRLLQQPSHCSQKCAIARILHPCATGATPQRCFPPPARSPVPRLPRSGPRPTVTRSQGARHAAPPSLPRAAARSHRAPSPEYRPAAARTHWARLVRIAPTACRRPHRIYPTACRHPRHPPISLLALRRPQGPGWQEPRRMHPFFAECAKKALFLATSARNACFPRSRWQHPRPMHPFPGAIGRFGIHGARILPPRALFRVEEPEITHGAKMLPAPPGLSAAAACGTRHGRTGLAPCVAGLACLPHAPPPCRLACVRRGLRLPAISPAFIAAVLHAPRFAVRDPPRGPRTDASRYLRAAPIPPATRAHRVQETSGTTQTTQCGHKNRIPKWGPH